jgi:hypothetical protein
MQVSPATMSRPSPRASAALCLLLFIKGPLKEGLGLLLLPWALASVFPFGLLLWAFCCGKLLEGKRIAKGKLLKGKEWLKRG